MADEAPLPEDEFFDAEVFGHASEGDGLDEFLGGLRDGAEAVGEALAVGVEFLFGGEVVELFVEQQALADAGDVVVGQEHFEVGFDDALFDVLFGFFHFVAEEVAEFGLFEFVDGFVEDFVVHVVADVADEAALLGAKDVACAADVEVAHGDVESAADGAEFLDGFEAFLGLVGEDAVGGDEQVAEGFFVAAPHTAAHLVEVAEAEVLGVVDEHGVGVGDVEAVLDERGGYKHVHIA